jgi:hypothetical protein
MTLQLNLPQGHFLMELNFWSDYAKELPEIPDRQVF